MSSSSELAAAAITQMVGATPVSALTIARELKMDRRMVQRQLHQQRKAGKIKLVSSGGRPHWVAEEPPAAAGAVPGQRRKHFFIDFGSLALVDSANHLSELKTPVTACILKVHETLALHEDIAVVQSESTAATMLVRMVERLALNPAEEAVVVSRNRVFRRLVSDVAGTSLAGRVTLVQDSEALDEQICQFY